MPEALDTFEAIEAFSRSLWQTLAPLFGEVLRWLVALAPVLLVFGHGRTIELLHRNLHTEERNPHVIPKIPAPPRRRSGRTTKAGVGRSEWFAGRVRWCVDFAYGLFRNVKWFQGLLSTRTLGRFVFLLFKPLPSWTKSSAPRNRRWTQARRIIGLLWLLAIVSIITFRPQWPAWLRVTSTTVLIGAGLWLFWRLVRFVAQCLGPMFHPELVYHRAQVYIELNQLLEDRASSEKIEIEEEYLGRVAAFSAQLKQSASRVQVSQPIECFTLFDVFDKKDKIRHYFETQEDLPPLGWSGWIRFLWSGVIHAQNRGDAPSATRFLCPLKIKSGFLCPTYLVSGLLAEFDEDWKRIVWSYRRDTALSDDDQLRHYEGLRKLQVFIWDCWIQWGPSVPICAARDWQDGPIGLQYGYGDENNSLPLTFESAREWTALKKRYEGWQEGSKRAIAPLVVPASVQAELRWNPPQQSTAETNDFCSSQRRLQLETDTDEHRRKKSRLTLNATAIGPKWDSSQLYSAYVWVMIAICKKKETAAPGEPTYELLYPRQPPTGQGECWRGLIPFFQHGNIAEHSVYLDIKEELATKAVDSLMRFLEESRAEYADDEIEFAYACAFDDNGDYSATESSKPLAGRVPDNQSIREMMVIDLKRYGARHPETSKETLERLKNRIHLNCNSVPEITASQLPAIVQEFLNATSDIPDTTGMGIIDLRDASEKPNSGRVLSKTYAELYLPSFPYKNEQESEDQYRERLFLAPGGDADTHFLVAGSDFETEEKTKVAGFLIVEWYRKSRCGLLTYLAVTSAARQQGLASRLVARGLELLVQKNGGISPRAVFAETGNPESPDRAAGHADTMHPGDRLQVLGRLGAFLVPIEHYVQPSLGPEQGPSDQLIFLAFDPAPPDPLPETPTLTIPGEVIASFLDEFYQSLGARRPEDLQSLDLMKQEISQSETADPQQLDAKFNRFGLPIVTVTKAAQ